VGRVTPVTGSGAARGLSGTAGAAEGATRGGGWGLVQISSPRVTLAEPACRRSAVEWPERAWVTSRKSGTCGIVDLAIAFDMGNSLVSTFSRGELGNGKSIKS